MLPVKVPGETRVFGKPENWDPEKMGDCGLLSIKDERENGAATMVSWWEPDQDELLALIVGGRIQLRIFGQVHPVVSMGVVARPDLIETLEEAKKS